MASRAELELRAAAVNVASASYPNDSKFEQAVLYSEKQVTSTSSATQIVAPVVQVAKVSGDKNV